MNAINEFVPVIFTNQQELDEYGGQNLELGEFVSRLQNALLENGYWEIYKTVIDVMKGNMGERQAD